MPTATRPQAPSALPSWDKSAWEKGPAPRLDKKKKFNPLMVVAALLILALGISGMWRVFHAPSATKWVQVVAINQDTPAGVRLGFMQVHFIPVPRQYVQKDMITDLNQIAGRVTRTFISAKEPISKAMLFQDRAVSYNLETHERAITLQLSEEALVDHAIEADDRVDVIAVTTREAKKYTKTICQDVRVLMAIPKEQTLARRLHGNSSNRITLAVPAGEAEALSEAMETGKIRLVLRNRLSKVVHSLPGASQDDLLPPSAFEPERATRSSNGADSQSPVGQLPPPPQAPPTLDLPALPELPAMNGGQSPSQWLVEVFSGSKKEMYEFPAH